MTAKAKAKTRRRSSPAKRSRALAVRDPNGVAPPPPAEAVYVRLPLSPETVGVIRRHTEAIAAVVDDARALQGRAVDVEEGLRELGRNTGALLEYFAEYFL